MDPEETQMSKQLQERFAQLPKVVQDAINSADIEKHLRELADTHKLHLDQWETLENEVMLTLMGFERSEDLEKNIEDEVGVPQDVAAALATDISKVVFEPVREELERALNNPHAKDEVIGAVEAAGKEALAQEHAPAVAPATPPPPPTEEKVVRAPISEAYKAGEPSVARKSVEDDPYREPVA
jgi:hypothetical protein